jgi:hypothetical protein
VPRTLDQRWALHAPRHGEAVITLDLIGGPADGRHVTLFQTSRPPVRYIALGGAVYAPARETERGTWRYVHIGSKDELE